MTNSKPIKYCLHYIYKYSNIIYTYGQTIYTYRQTVYTYGPTVLIIILFALSNISVLEYINNLFPEPYNIHPLISKKSNMLTAFAAVFAALLIAPLMALLVNTNSSTRENHPLTIITKHNFPICKIIAIVISVMLLLISESLIYGGLICLYLTWNLIHILYQLYKITYSPEAYLFNFLDEQNDENNKIIKQFKSARDDFKKYCEDNKLLLNTNQLSLAPDAFVSKFCSTSFDDITNFHRNKIIINPNHQKDFYIKYTSDELCRTIDLQVYIWEQLTPQPSSANESSNAIPPDSIANKWLMQLHGAFDCGYKPQTVDFDQYFSNLHNRFISLMLSNKYDDCVSEFKMIKKWSDRSGMIDIKFISILGRFANDLIGKYCSYKNSNLDALTLTLEEYLMPIVQGIFLSALKSRNNQTIADCTRTYVRALSVFMKNNKGRLTFKIDEYEHEYERHLTELIQRENLQDKDRMLYFVDSLANMYITTSEDDYVKRENMIVSFEKIVIDILRIMIEDYYKVKDESEINRHIYYLASVRALGLSTIKEDEALSKQIYTYIKPEDFFKIICYSYINKYGEFMYAPKSDEYDRHALGKIREYSIHDHYNEIILGYLKQMNDNVNLAKLEQSVLKIWDIDGDRKDIIGAKNIFKHVMESNNLDKKVKDLLDGLIARINEELNKLCQTSELDLSKMETYADKCFAQFNEINKLSDLLKNDVVANAYENNDVGFGYSLDYEKSYYIKPDVDRMLKQYTDRTRAIQMLSSGMSNYENSKLIDEICSKYEEQNFNACQYFNDTITKLTKDRKYIAIIGLDVWHQAFNEKNICIYNQNISREYDGKNWRIKVGHRSHDVFINSQDKMRGNIFIGNHDNYTLKYYQPSQSTQEQSHRYQSDSGIMHISYEEKEPKSQGESPKLLFKFYMYPELIIKQTVTIEQGVGLYRLKNLPLSQ